jgi:predicted TIM-barrel fold metal-dependent hydrolase
LVAQPAKRLIVDAQIHMWKANSPDRPWADGARPQTPNR